MIEATFKARFRASSGVADSLSSGTFLCNASMIEATLRARFRASSGFADSLSFHAFVCDAVDD